MKTKLLLIVFFLLGNIILMGDSGVIDCKLYASTTSDISQSDQTNLDLLFTVIQVESFVTITGWASNGYRCNVEEILEGNIEDSVINLYVFHDGEYSNLIDNLELENKLLMGFSKIIDERFYCEGFTSQDGTHWELILLEIIENQENSD